MGHKKQRVSDPEGVRARLGCGGALAGCVGAFLVGCICRALPQVGNQRLTARSLSEAGHGRAETRSATTGGGFWVWLCPGWMRECIEMSRKAVTLFRLSSRMEPGVTVRCRAGSAWALPRSCIYRCQSRGDWCARLRLQQDRDVLHDDRESEGCRSRGRVPLRRCAAWLQYRTCVLLLSNTCAP